MELNSTFYANVSRTISGLANVVFPNDVIIVCDTSLGAVNLLLADIPSGAWNTTYKLYVQDNGSASTNNITITAPTGYTINGQPTLVISSDNANAIIRIAQDKSYLAVLTSGSGGGLAVLNQSIPLVASATSMNFLGIEASAVGSAVTIKNAFISGSLADISILISNNELIPNQWYNIQDAFYGYFNHKFNVYVPAISSNGLSNFGIGEFFDADYEQQGDYSGVSGYAGQLGIWTNSLTPVIGNVCIWNNLHYVNNTGVNTIIDPSSDPTNWSELPYSSKNGYIVVYDQIIYGFKNRIWFRKDKFNNEVEHYDIVGLTSFDRFPFGNGKVFSNKVLNNSYWNFCNTIIASDVQNNTLLHTELYWTTLANVKTCSSNNFTGTIRPLDWRNGHPELQIMQNNFSFCQGVSFLENCKLELNNFVNSSIALTLKGCIVSSNSTIGSSIGFEKTHSIFSRNNLIYSNWVMTTSSGSETDNNVENSQINIGTNDGIIQYNNINQFSTLTITSITASGLLNYNTITGKTSFGMASLDANFGASGVKGTGNTFSNCDIQISTFIGEFFANTMVQIQIIINKFTGTIARCEFFGSSQITIEDMTNKTMIGIQAKQFIYGSIGYVMPQSYTGGVYLNGLATINCTIDCSDPAIYDLPSQTLIIPTELRSWGGIFTLSNANGLTIKKVLNTTEDAPYTFFNDNGSTTFSTTNVAGAVNGEMISNVIPTGFTINYRLNGSDYIVTNRVGLLVALTEINIFI